MDKKAWELGLIEIMAYGSIELERVMGGWCRTMYSPQGSTITFIPFISYEAHEDQVEESSNQLYRKAELLKGTNAGLDKLTIRK